MTASPFDPAEELQQLFLQLKDCHGDARERLVSQIVEHPHTQEKLHAACGAVMRRWSRRIDLRADVLQEAVCHSLRTLQTPQFEYVDEGMDRFRGWFWKLWFNACAEAWRRCRPLWLRAVELIDQEPLEEVCAAEFRNPRWECVVEEIDRLPEPKLRGVMQEWAGGQTGKDSASRLGISEATVARLRQQGLDRLRHRLGARRPGPNRPIAPNGHYPLG